MNIWDVLFSDERGKNLQTLLDLEISKNYRKTVLSQLTHENYYEGPIKNDIDNLGDL